MQMVPHEGETHLTTAFSRGFVLATGGSGLSAKQSPQVIGEVQRDEIRILSTDNLEEAKQPTQSKGMDSNWILEVVQRADERDPKVKQRIKASFEKLARKEIGEAEKDILQLRGEFGNSGDVQRAASQLERLKLLNP